MATTYNNLYLDARQRLLAAGVEMAQLEARELVCAAAGKTKEQLFRDLSLYASQETEDALLALLRRRMEGEPVAYLVGEWEFYGLPLYVTPDTLIPRPDTETVAQRAILLAEAAGEGARVLDLCCGTGCIGLAVAAHVPGCRVVLADLSEQALKVAKANVRRHDLNSRVTCLLADALSPPSPALWDFDVIVCNPPYITKDEMAVLDHSVRNYEPWSALDGGEDGLIFYRAVAGQWGTALRLGGCLVFEIGATQREDVASILASHGFSQILSHQDPGGHWRVVEGIVPEQAPLTPEPID